MVTEAFLQVLADILGRLMGLFPDWEWPANIGIPDRASFQGVGLPVDSVLDLGLALSCITAIVGAWLVAAGIKLVRMIISHFTGGGGMA